MEVLENIIRQFSAVCKPKAHYLDIWCELEGLALYWDCGAGDFSMCDDPERGAELVGLVGFMVLATLQELKKRDVLTPSNRIPNLGYILSIMICCGWNRGRELSDEYMDCVPWVYRVMDVAHEAGIVIAGARGYERVAEEIGSEEADGKTPELVKKWEKSVFSTKVRSYKSRHAPAFGPVRLDIGGDHYDLTTMKPAERKKHSYSSRDPFAFRP